LSDFFYQKLFCCYLGHHTNLSNKEQTNNNDTKENEIINNSEKEQQESGVNKNDISAQVALMKVWVEDQKQSALNSFRSFKEKLWKDDMKVITMSIATTGWAIFIFLIFWIFSALRILNKYDYLLLGNAPHLIAGIMIIIFDYEGSKQSTTVNIVICVLLLILDLVTFVWRIIILIECYNGPQHNEIFLLSDHTNWSYCVRNAIKQVTFIVLIFVLVILTIILLTFVLGLSNNKQNKIKAELNMKRDDVEREEEYKNQIQNKKK
jgi:hypothetical protein